MLDFRADGWPSSPHFSKPLSLVHEKYFMITIVNKPEVVCKKLTRDILFALINHDFGIILGKTSHEYGKWTKEKLQTDVKAATRGKWVCEFTSIVEIAPPVLTGDQKMYEYIHALPVDGEWDRSHMVLRLHHKSQSLYALELAGFFKDAPAK